MLDQPPPKLFTIRETNARIRAILEKETVGKCVWIGGIVRRHHVSDLGHAYFDLYDDDHTIRCMVRAALRGELSFTVANGMELEVCGTVRVYEKHAQVEFEIQDVRLVQSILPVLNEEVEARLTRTGIWPRPRRALPGTINGIGLITSTHSEAKDDFRDTFYREGGTAPVTLKDVRVQGQLAPREIADAINWFNQPENKVDVIVLARGGGRMADLAVFSDYLVAEAICRSAIPVVTGIGHQSDSTAADLVADVSTITPTAAAVRLAQRVPAEEAPAAAHPGRRAQVTEALGVVLWVIIAIVILVIYLGR